MHVTRISRRSNATVSPAPKPHSTAPSGGLGGRRGRSIARTRSRHPTRRQSTARAQPRNAAKPPSTSKGGPLPDPLVDADVDGVARLLADRLAQLRPDGQPVRAVALRHQRAVERLAVDLAADLHEPARAEQLRHVVHHDARPRTRVVALVKLGVELSEHVSETLACAVDFRAARSSWGRPTPKEAVMKFMLLIHQDTTPIPGTDAWEN